MFLIEGMKGYQILFTGSKILFLSGVIATQNLDFTYDYIAVARFNRDYLKTMFFQFQNNKAFTVFKVGLCNFPDIF